MAEHPLIFSSAMIRAILEGRKSVTRRLADYSKWKKGDRVWVRETFALGRSGSLDIPGYVRHLDYYADGLPFPDTLDVPEQHWQLWDDACDEWEKPYNKKPSIHMPRWASRITLELTEDVRREPLVNFNGMPELDAIKEAEREGFEQTFDPTWNAHSNFITAWDNMHPDQPWLSNPIVSVINFKRI